MFDLFLLMVIVALAIMVKDLRERVRRIERSSADGIPAPLASTVDLRPVPPVADAARPLDAKSETSGGIDAGPGARGGAAPPPRLAQRFETLVGGRLPIWIGGIALAFAGFFLVRYSIDLGLFGPGARSLLAALFGIVLLILAQYGPGVPRLGGFVASDPRIGQSLAGAGIATLYGTLYMAAELYGLIGIGIAFVLVVLVTVVALALALRHGPPTAIMGLTGGYLAPLVAGLPQSSLISTLLYLAVFTFGLIGLAVWRKWAWLALIACGASLVWTGWLLVIADSGAYWGIGVLIVGPVVATMIAMKRIATGWAANDRLNVVPLGIGVLQLVVLAALSDYGPGAWLVLASLSVAAIVLAWRRAIPVAGLWIVFALALITLLGSFVGHGPDFERIVPGIGFALLFGIPAQWCAWRGGGSPDWMRLGVLAPLAPLCLAMMVFASPASHLTWGFACFVAGLPIYALIRSGNSDAVTERLALAGLLVAAVALVGFVVPGPLYPMGFALLFAALAAWRRHDRAGPYDIRAIALLIAAIAMLLPARALVGIALDSLNGAVLHYASIAPLGALTLKLALPALVVAAIAHRVALPRALDRMAVIVAGLALLGFAYALAKQPLGIATDARFIRFGFLERALLTQSLLIAAAWLATRRDGGDLYLLAVFAGGLGLARFVVFDLILLNPVMVEQAVGAWLLINAATIHAAGVGGWCWLLAHLVALRTGPKSLERPLRFLSLVAMGAAALVGVRQAVHGSILAGPAIGSGENYLYSAALLVLSLAWLSAGIVRTDAVLRVGGLALLTLVTLKVFLIDAAALEGLLRVLSFLGLGAALIGIGWAYGRLAARDRTTSA